MPVITYEGCELDEEKKKQLIVQFTSMAAELTDFPRQAFTVVIREQPLENIGVGGETLTELKARLAKAKVKLCRGFYPNSG